MILYVLSNIMIIVAIIGGIVSFFYDLFGYNLESHSMKITMITSILLLIMSIIGLVYSYSLNSVIKYHYIQHIISITESKNEMKKFLIKYPEYKEIYEKENLE